MKVSIVAESRQADLAFDSQISEPYRALINPGPRAESSLAKAILHVVAHPGGFVRGDLALQTGRLLGLNYEWSEKLAVAVEYFHTASLIFDDLSCMDDAGLRRGVRCVHVIFGEATAMLAALAFINRAYGLIMEVTAHLPQARIERINDLVESCLGTDGVLSGQSRDLAFGPSDREAEKILEIAEGKTVSLLHLALSLPAIAGGASAKTVTNLQALAYARGLGYQIVDDFKDVFLCENESGKTSNRDQMLLRPNLVACEGVPMAARRLEELVNQGDQIEQELYKLDCRWAFLRSLRLSVGPNLLNDNGIPLAGKL